MKKGHEVWPVGTAVFLCAAVIATAWPGAAVWAVGERESLVAGELWRLWSAHAVHFSWSHLGWSGLVWLVAGGLLERETRHGWMWMILLLAPLITVTALVLDPDLARYGGLSGLATAPVVWLGLHWVTRERGILRAVGGLVLAGVGWKIVNEWGSLGDNPVFAEFDPVERNIRVASWAHVTGALGGAFFATVNLVRQRAAQRRCSDEK